MYPYQLNDLVFTTPAAIEVPIYLSQYIGALIDAKRNNWYNDIINYFSAGTGSAFFDRGCLILADYSDVNNYISDNDKTIFQSAFNDFYRNADPLGDYGKLLIQIQNLYNVVKADTTNNKYKSYSNNLDPNKPDSFYSKILEPLIKRTNLIVFSQNTFSMNTTYPIGYVSIKTLNDDTIHPNYKTVNDAYFKAFLSNLYTYITKKMGDLTQQQQEDDKKKADIDIVTETYYSFKNINDKWLTGT